MEFVLYNKLVWRIIFIGIFLCIIYISYMKKVWSLLILCLFASTVFSYGIICDYLVMKSHIIVEGIVSGSSSPIKQGRSWGYYFYYNGEQFTNSGVPFDFPNINTDSIQVGQKYEVWVNPSYPYFNIIDFSKRID